MMERFINRGMTVKKERDHSIDIMKGFLVLLMILAHVIQFFPDGKFDEYFSLYVNLTTFSGFMFCLGYVFPLAYSNRAGAEKRMFIGFLKTLIAYYVSGCCYIAIIEQKLTVSLFIDILLLKRVPFYSEFLLSLALVFAFGIFLFKPLEELMENKIKFSLVVIFCLLCTGIDYSNVRSGLLGSVIGSSHFNNFPILQYGFYFLIGFYLSEKKITFNWWVLAISLIGTIMFSLSVVCLDIIPSRFPPSLSWVVGASFFVYVYFLLCKLIKKCPPVSIIGKESLIFLIVSNIMIFSAKTIFVNVNFPLWLFKTILYIVIILVCFVIVLIKKYGKLLIKKIMKSINTK